MHLRLNLPASSTFSSHAVKSLTKRCREASGCMAALRKMVNCSGWASRAPSLGESPALQGQVRNLYANVLTAGKLGVTASVAVSEACQALMLWAEAPDSAGLGCGDLTTHLATIGNAYADHNDQLAAQWRRNWLAGVEDWGQACDAAVAVRAVVSAACLARSELLNVQRMRPELR